MTTQRTGNEPLGTIFQLGKINIRYLHTLWIYKKCMLKIIPFWMHLSPGSEQTNNQINEVRQTKNSSKVQQISHTELSISIAHVQLQSPIPGAFRKNPDFEHATDLLISCKYTVVV